MRLATRPQRSGFATDSLFDALEPRQMLTADLSVGIGEFVAPSTVVPGDVLRVPVIIQNLGASGFTGAGSPAVRIQIFASQDASTATAGDDTQVYLSPANITIGTVARPFAADASLTILATVETSTTLLPFGTYHLFARLVTVDANGAVTGILNDEFNANNTSGIADPFAVQWQFGADDDRGNVRFTGRDADGTVYTYSLAGPGSALIIPAAGNSPDRVVLTGTTSRTTLSILLTRPGAGPSAATVDLTARIEISQAAGGDTGSLAAIVAPAVNFDTDPGNANRTSSIEVENGAIGAITVRDFFGTITVPGSVTTFRANDIAGDVSIGGRLGSATVRDIFPADAGASPITRSTLLVGGAMGSLTARNVSGFDLDIGAYGTTNITLQDVENSSIFSEGGIGALSLRSWTFGEGDVTASQLQAVFINSLTTARPPAANPGQAGNFAAAVYLTGRIARPATLGAVNIGGTLSGSFIVVGNVTSFIAAAIDTPAGTPSLAASGTVRSFTTLAGRGVTLYGATLGTVAITAAGNDATQFAEVLAGIRFTAADLFDGGNLVTGADFTPDRWVSGQINDVRLTINTTPGTAAYVARVASSVDPNLAAPGSDGIAGTGDDIFINRAGTVASGALTLVRRASPNPTPTFVFTDTARIRNITLAGTNLAANAIDARFGALEYTGVTRVAGAVVTLTDAAFLGAAAPNEIGPAGALANAIRFARLTID